jgi:hypothetical protein
LSHTCPPFQPRSASRLCSLPRPISLITGRGSPVGFRRSLSPVSVRSAHLS